MTAMRLASDLADGIRPEAPGVEERLDARRVAERVGGLLAEIGAIADPRLTGRTEDLVSLLMQFYGAGIQRMMEIADDADLLEGELLDRFIQDELVSSLLVIHDLHPVDLDTRVRVALDKVRPYLGSHGGDVEILGIEGDVVRLRMEGSCSSCPSSAVTLNFAIEKAILEAAPEISRIEAEEASPQGAPLIQLAPRPGHVDVAGPAVPTRSEWLALDPAERPGPAGLRSIELGDLRILVCRAGNELYAYRDRCPNCRSGLGDGRLIEPNLRCATCGHTFDVRRAGRSVDDSDLHLEPLPLLSDGGSVRIAVPVQVFAVAAEGVVGSAAFSVV